MSHLRKFRPRLQRHAVTLGLALAALTTGPVLARDIGQLVADIDADILQQPLPAPLAQLSILSGIAPPSEDFADRKPPQDATDRQLATSTLVPPRLPEPRPIILPETVADEPHVPFDLEMPEAVRRDPFAPQAGPQMALPEDSLAPPPVRPLVIRATVPALTSEQIARLARAAQEFRRGNHAAGEALAAGVTDPTLKLALEWLALRSLKQSAGFQRITGFLARSPDFPMAQWLRRRAEEALFIESPPAETVRAFFATTPPEMAGGKIALARVLSASGEVKVAEALVRDAYRDNKTTAALRAAIRKDFPGVVGAADQRYLAERLIYDGASAEGLRVASEAGPATLRIAQALALSLAENAGVAAHLQKLDAQEMKQPAVQFARIQLLRRTGKFSEAADLMATVPRDGERIVDGDEWWTERRLLARKLLDAGDPQRAYDVASGHLAEASAQIVDAEVHAGWIALRFLKQPATAARHFEAARSAARAPASIARAAYWQGRAADAAQDPMAHLHYLAAAGHRHSYYGQLARDRLGPEDGPERQVQHSGEALERAAKSSAFRVIRALIDADALDFAQPLVIDVASTAPTAEPLVSLGDLLAQYRQTRLTVIVGKLAMQRGLPLEEHAFPTNGLPEFQPTTASPEAAIVMSIARQESEFNPKAVSHAGARGLMQLMPATARRTAERNGMPFDVGRLTADPAYNARIGAAHLGELFGEYGGSYLLSFAAYNAGGKRVKEWTTAYGDPRDPNVDKVDWIERIPISETRHYVQKVMENLQVYRARLNGTRIAAITPDLERGARRIKSAVSLKLAELPPIGAPDIR